MFSEIKVSAKLRSCFRVENDSAKCAPNVPLTELWEEFLLFEVDGGSVGSDGGNCHGLGDVLEHTVKCGVEVV